jgi:hypothetical protein
MIAYNFNGPVEVTDPGKFQINQCREEATDRNFGKVSRLISVASILVTNMIC